MDEIAPNREKWIGLGHALVLGSVAALILPVGLLVDLEVPDTIEHISIANAFVHGSGFVDPIEDDYYLEQTAPLPAFCRTGPGHSSPASDTPWFR